MTKQNTRLIVRGGGDLASGVIHRLYRSHYHVLILECRKPSAIRRRVAFCEAVYDGTSSVEGVTCRRVTEPSQCEKVWSNGEIPLLIDETGESVQKIQPDAVIDAILAKKKSGNNQSDGTSYCWAGAWFYCRRRCGLCSGDPEGT